jgi:hypothetical protein
MLCGTRNAVQDSRNVWVKYNYSLQVKWVKASGSEIGSVNVYMIVSSTLVTLQIKSDA